mmetsp:Transcript_770/g.1817  ORF Transcript_770/g.1817 Transcript_770/m.1817 type:complete len:218 (+) Transcript_770:1803-2456(+)
MLLIRNARIVVGQHCRVHSGEITVRIDHVGEQHRDQLSQHRGDVAMECLVVARSGPKLQGRQPHLVLGVLAGLEHKITQHGLLALDLVRAEPHHKAEALAHTLHDVTVGVGGQAPQHLNVRACKFREVHIHAVVHKHEIQAEVVDALTPVLPVDQGLLWPHELKKQGKHLCTAELEEPRNPGVRGVCTQLLHEFHRILTDLLQSTPRPIPHVRVGVR